MPKRKEPSPFAGSLAVTTTTRELRALLRVPAAVAAKPGVLVGPDMLRLAARGGSLVIEANDLSCALSVRTGMPVEGADSLLVCGRTLARIVAALPPGELRLTTRRGVLCLAAADIDVEVDVIADNPEFGFPMPESIATPHTVAGPALAGMLANAPPFASADSSRPHLASVCLRAEGAVLRATATDGHRLLTVTTETKADLGRWSAVLPFPSGRVLLALLRGKDADVRLGIEAARLVVETDTTTFSARPVDLPFPAFEQVIPTEDFPPVLLPRLATIAVLARLTRVAGCRRKSTPVVIVTHQEDGVRVTLDARGDGIRPRARILCTVPDDAPCRRFGVNAQYLAAALRALPGDTAEMRAGAALDPIAFRAGTLTVVVMPARVE